MGISSSSTATATGAPIWLLPLKGTESAVGQGTWSTLVDSNNILCFYFNNDGSGADGDNITFKINLPYGSYKLAVQYGKDTNKGITDFDYNGTEIHSYDSYNAGGVTRNNLSLSSAFTATGGVTDFRIRMHGKNAGSSSYRTSIYGIFFIPQ